MNLQTTIDIDFKGFFRWWGKELSFLIPAKLQTLLTDGFSKLVLTASDTGFKAVFYDDESMQAAIFQKSINLDDQDTFLHLKQQYNKLEKAEITLSLQQGQALAKFIYLPEAALENIQQVVGFELDRYTPYKADQVYFTALPLSKTGLGQIQVLLVVTPQYLIDEYLLQLNQIGIYPVRIDYALLNNEYPQLKGEYNLLPNRYRPVSNKLAESIHWFLNIIIFLLLMGVFALPVEQEKQNVEILKQQLKLLEKETHVVDEQQLEIENLQQTTQRLIDLKMQTPDLVVVLNELSRILKDDTWLSNIQYSEKHMQINGQSPTASTLISLLEESNYFSKVSFVSPLTQDKASGLERFQISMDVNSSTSSSDQPSTTTTMPQSVPDLPVDHSAEHLERDGR